MTEHSLRRVPPFGYPRIIACLRLPVAFRSLPRPSSAISALASTLRSSSLDLLCLRAALLRPLRRPFGLLVSACSLFLCSFQGADERPPGEILSPGEPSKRYSEGIWKNEILRRFLSGSSPRRFALRLSFALAPVRSALRFAPSRSLRPRVPLGSSPRFSP